MKILNFISIFFIPLILFVIVLYAVLQKKPVFDLFTKGWIVHCMEYRSFHYRSVRCNWHFPQFRGIRCSLPPPESSR